MIYIGTFIISLLFFSLALKYRKNNKKVFVLFSIIGIIIPCILAGLRDYSIGVDVNVYLKPLFDVANYFNSFFKYINNTGSEVKDYGFLLLVFACRKISDNIFILLFIIEFLMVMPIYIALLNVTDKKRIIITGMFIFYMTFYNLSFNLIRQGVAIMICILAFTCFIKNKKIQTLILICLAFSFHSSALMIIPALVLYKFLENRNYNSKGSVGIKAIIVFILMFLIIFLPELIRLLIVIGVLDSVHYGRYLNNMNGIDINFIRTAWYILFYVFFIISKKRLIENLNNYSFYIFLSFISIIVLQFGAIIQFAERIGYYYFFISLIIGIPFTCDSDSKTINNRIIKICIYMSFIIYWLYWSVYIGSNQTYPFVFRA